jgi:eukaryotic-like serine/threonine-protein kinase
MSLGRYLLFDEIAAGGMASVHFGCLSGAAGFSRVVAIKRLHANLAKDPEFVTMFLDEAHLAARIRHPNVVSTLDVVAIGGEVFLVMEYVHSQSLAKLWRAMRTANTRADPRIVATVMSSVLHGLHAAHEARGERGERLDIVHRDVSPQNILVGIDGLARVFDFGVAKAVGRVQTTREGRIKGKLAYMPPEQLHGAAATRRVDIYAAGVVTWEMLTGERAFGGPHEAAVITAILAEALPQPSKVAAHVPAAFDAVVMRALHRDPARRYATALDMAKDIERCAGIASMSEVAQWVHSYAHEELGRRAERMAFIERGASGEAGPAAADAPSGRPALSASSIPTKLSGHWHGRGNVDEASPSVSRVAVSSTLARLMRPPRRRVGLAASAAIASLLGLTWLVRSLAGGSAPADPVSWPTTAVSGARVDVTSEPIARTPTALTTAAGPAAAFAPTDRKPAATPAASSASIVPTRPAGKQKRDCDPPFTIDENHHKLYKAFCL